MSYLYGCDPEMFVKDGNKFIPAYNMIPGTKDKPHKVRNGAVQVDGLALEFNIDPVDNVKDWAFRIKDVKQQMADMIPKGYTLHATPSADFVENDFINLPPEAKVLGCDPDFNAYSGLTNIVPEGAGDKPYRCAGGHVHIGWQEPNQASLDDPVHQQDCRLVVKALDQTLGFLSALFDRDTERARLYGQAGAFRIKPYGVEYRTLSNAWIETEARINWVFETTKLTLEILERNPEFFNIRDDWVIHSTIRSRDPYYINNNCDHKRRLEKAGFNTKVA